MTEILVGILTGVLSSLVASSLFLFILLRLRPKIEISPYIAVQERKKGTAYIIKIINKTQREIIDIQSELVVATPINVMDGTITTIKRLKLETPNSFYMNKYDKKDRNAEYAGRYLTYEDIDLKWPDDSVSYLQFRILAKDSLSGFSNYFHHSFYVKENCLIKGSHKFGDNLDIL